MKRRSSPETSPEERDAKKTRVGPTPSEGENTRQHFRCAIERYSGYLRCVDPSSSVGKIPEPTALDDETIRRYMKHINECALRSERASLPLVFCKMLKSCYNIDPNDYEVPRNIEDVKRQEERWRQLMTSHKDGSDT